MTINEIKTKLIVLDTPGFPGVLYDALSIYINDVIGRSLNKESISIIATELILQLKQHYIAELPKKQHKVIQTDLIDLIEEIISHPDYEKQKKSCKLGKQKLDPNDFLPKEEQDGQDNH